MKKYFLIIAAAASIFSSTVFADEYARLRGFDAEECYKLLVAFRSTQPGKIDGLY